jgi:hypothetical protein
VTDQEVVIMGDTDGAELSADPRVLPLDVLQFLWTLLCQQRLDVGGDDFDQVAAMVGNAKRAIRAAIVAHTPPEPPANRAARRAPQHINGPTRKRPSKAAR